MIRIRQYFGLKTNPPSAETLKADRYFLNILYLWTAIQVIQALFSGLIHDEAYYWLWSQHLDWGYYEQPPAVAFFIWCSDLIFNGHLKVRAMAILLSSGMIWHVWKLSESKNWKAAWFIIAACWLSHSGFLAVPDTFLLFAVSLFLRWTKSYLTEPNPFQAILLGFALALLSYTKYHAIVVLIPVFLVNWSLVKRWDFWLIPLVGTVLYIPHILWQIEYDYPPIQFHVLNRQTEPWTIEFPLAYLAGQILVFGPVSFWLLIISIRKLNIQDRFEKTMLAIFVGVLLFFLLLSFRGRVEINWTASALIPLLYFSIRFFDQYPDQLKKWIPWFILSISLVVLLRLLVLFGAPWMTGLPRNEFHGWKKWANQIESIAGDRTVIFYNSYQHSSKYAYYTGKPSFSQNTIEHAGNQFEIWYPQELAFQKDSVLVLTRWQSNPDTIIGPGNKPIYFRERFPYETLGVLKIEVDVPKTVLNTDTLTMEATLINPTRGTVDIPHQLAHIKYVYFLNNKRVRSGIALPELKAGKLEPGASRRLKLTVIPPENPGEYRFRLGIDFDFFLGQNSHFFRQTVKSGSMDSD